MTTSSQLPVVRNIELLRDTAASISIALGFSISGSLTASAKLFSGFTTEGTNVLSLPVSVANHSTGEIVISFTSANTYTLRNGAAWELKASGVSAEDPPELVRTLAWGRISVVSQADLSSGSPLYHAVEMVSGDEFTFQVNLGMSVSGMSLSARLVLPAGAGGFTDLSVLNLPVWVLSASSGLIKVTIDETRSGFVDEPGWGWVLENAQSQTVLRAGPVTAYTRDSISGPLSTGVGEAVAAPAVPNLGSVFL